MNDEERKAFEKLNLVQKIIDGMPEDHRYFKPGWPFEVRENVYGYKQLAYYNQMDGSGNPLFVIFYENVGRPGSGHTYECYRPLNTIWDSEFTPDWVQWIVWNGTGFLYGYEGKPVLDQNRFGWRIGEEGKYLRLGATNPSGWRDSLEQRPWWAR